MINPYLLLLFLFNGAILLMIIISFIESLVDSGGEISDYLHKEPEEEED